MIDIHFLSMYLRYLSLSHSHELKAMEVLAMEKENEKSKVAISSNNRNRGHFRLAGRSMGICSASANEMVIGFKQLPQLSQHGSHPTRDSHAGSAGFWEVWDRTRKLRNAPPNTGFWELVPCKQEYTTLSSGTPALSLSRVQRVDVSW